MFASISDFSRNLAYHEKVMTQAWSEALKIVEGKIKQKTKLTRHKIEEIVKIISQVRDVNARDVVDLSDKIKMTMRAMRKDYKAFPSDPRQLIKIQLLFFEGCFQETPYSILERYYAVVDYFRSLEMDSVQEEAGRITWQMRELLNAPGRLLLIVKACDECLKHGSQDDKDKLVKYLSYAVVDRKEVMTVEPRKAIVFVLLRIYQDILNTRIQYNIDEVAAAVEQAEKAIYPENNLIRIIEMASDTLGGCGLPKKNKRIDAAIEMLRKLDKEVQALEVKLYALKDAKAQDEVSKQRDHLYSEMDKTLEAVPGLKEEILEQFALVSPPHHYRFSPTTSAKLSRIVSHYVEEAKLRIQKLVHEKNFGAAKKIIDKLTATEKEALVRLSTDGIHFVNIDLLLFVVENCAYIPSCGLREVEGVLKKELKEGHHKSYEDRILFEYAQVIKAICNVQNAQEIYPLLLTCIRKTFNSSRLTTALCLAPILILVGVVDSPEAFLKFIYESLSAGKQKKGEKPIDPSEYAKKFMEALYKNPETARNFEAAVDCRRQAQKEVQEEMQKGGDKAAAEMLIVQRSFKKMRFYIVSEKPRREEVRAPYFEPLTFPKYQPIGEIEYAYNKMEGFAYRRDDKGARNFMRSGCQEGRDLLAEYAFARLANEGIDKIGPLTFILRHMGVVSPFAIKQLDHNFVKHLNERRVHVERDVIVKGYKPLIESLMLAKSVAEYFERLKERFQSVFSNSHRQAQIVMAPLFILLGITKDTEEIIKATQSHFHRYDEKHHAKIVEAFQKNKRLIKNMKLAHACVQEAEEFNGDGDELSEIREFLKTKEIQDIHSVFRDPSRIIADYAVTAILKESKALELYLEKAKGKNIYSSG